MGSYSASAEPRTTRSLWTPSRASLIHFWHGFGRSGLKIQFPDVCYICYEKSYKNLGWQDKNSQYSYSFVELDVAISSGWYSDQGSTCPGMI